MRRKSLDKSRSFEVWKDFDTPNGLAARLRSIVASSPILATILDRWAGIDLPDCWLSGSAIAQTAWNAAFDRSPEYGLADIDLVYFDAADLSEEGEARHAGRSLAERSESAAH